MSTKYRTNSQNKSISVYLNYQNIVKATILGISQVVKTIIDIKVENKDESLNIQNTLITREQWQAECKRKLSTGKDEFKKWQNALHDQSSPFTGKSNFFTWNIIYANDPQKPIEKTCKLDDEIKIVIDLSNQVFERNLNLEGFEFRYPVWFGDVTFNSSTSFKGARFKKGAYFLRATFGADTNFSKAEFYENVDFSDSIFVGYTNFFESKFKKGLGFKSVEFNDHTSFYCAEFELETDFNGAIFKAEVDFSGDRYDKNGNAEFDKLQTFSRISFDGVCFEKRATFNNRQFTGTTSFGKWDQKTKFHYAPLFHNCKLYQGTTFVDADFDTLKEDVGAVKAFNTLKLAMSQQQSTRDEHNFIKKELETERLNADSGKWLLYSLYLKTSDYGFSVKKPLIWLLLGPVLGFGFFYGLLTSLNHCNSSLFSDSCQFDGRLFFRTLEFSVLQNLPPLGLDRYSNSLFQYLFKNQSSLSELFLGFIIVLQKILALFCWFFVALALRNLFKMK